MKHVLRFIFTLLVIVGIGAIGFYAYTYADDSTGLITSSAGGSSLIISQVQQFSNLTLSQAIFQTPVYKSLKDFSVPVVPEPVSRPNPFAPIGQN